MPGNPALLRRVMRWPGNELAQPFCICAISASSMSTALCAAGRADRRAA